MFSKYQLFFIFTPILISGCTPLDSFDNSPRSNQVIVLPQQSDTVYRNDRERQQAEYERQQNKIEREQNEYERELNEYERETNQIEREQNEYERELNEIEAEEIHQQKRK